MPSRKLNGTVISVPHAAASRVYYTTMRDALFNPVDGELNTMVALRCVVRNIGFRERGDGRSSPGVSPPLQVGRSGHQRDLHLPPPAPLA